jgi:anti-sigma regulatory factor (Ser/Thr protein kinase)
LAALSEWRKEYPIRPGLSEDQVWREDVRLVLGGMPANVINIWQHGLTEIFNNALDHANADRIVIRIEKTAVDTVMSIADDGIGIFRKIQDELGLQDPRQAVLELSKGKMTTDPTRHSGEGIFFTTRMFERFSIHSGGVRFEHRIDPGHDYTLETGQPDAKGTTVSMTLDNHTSRTTKDVFDRFTDTEEYTFSKTVVPVELAVYGDENLISRSQAKRLLARVENFRTVTFDFHDVPSIGQAFADEIFRVFQSQHPDIRLVPINYSEEIGKMIGRARSGTVKSPV